MTYTYRLLPEHPDQQMRSVLRIEDNVGIPFDPANTDYQEYLAWVAEGNEPLPADDPS